jgi:myo-inositol-1(or 4)-monophosphatase
VVRSPAELAEIALRVAREAGALALAGWRSHPTVRLKGPADVVTQYDLESERLIRERLAAAAPEFAVVGEEEGGETRDGVAFYCDPIDGTTNFAHGHPMWCVSIGVVDHGRPVAGAVVAPALGTTWVGWRDGPSLRDGAPCRVSTTERIQDALIATGFPPERRQEPDNNFASYVRVKQAARAVRRCGSAALDACMVADGTYDGYWERRVKPWDLAGGVAVALAAGARLTALDGSEPCLEAGHVILSNGRIHAALIPLIEGP